MGEFRSVGLSHGKQGGGRTAGVPLLCTDSPSGTPAALSALQLPHLARLGASLI